MKGKSIKILLAVIASISAVGGVSYLLLNKDVSEEQVYKEEDKDIKEDEIIDNDLNDKEEDLNGDKDNVSNEVNNGTQSKPSVKPKPTPINPVEPEVPIKPEDPELPLEEDIEITNDMLTNNTYKIVDKKVGNITIRSDIKSSAKIILDGVEIVERLTLENPGKYQLDIVNSEIKDMVVANNVRSIRSMFRSVVFKTINKTIEGATINLQGNSNVDTMVIDNNVHINGSSSVSKVLVNDTTEVILNVPVNTLELNTDGYVAINQNATNVINNGESSIVINASVENMENNAKSNIKINKQNVVTNFNNNAEDTIVSGTGTVVNAVMAASNTKMFTNVVNKQINDNVDYILIRQEKDIQIVDAVSKGQGKVVFTLSSAAELKIKDISVICNAGKSITLYNLSTKDNITYTLSTSYFKNDSYALYITLPNGNIVSTDFDTDYANPTTDNVTVERISDKEALLKLYGVDEGGTFYYLVEEINQRESISADMIKKNGKSASVKVGFNSVTLNGLETGKSYNIYYVIEGYYENVSKVKGPIEIGADVKEKIPGTYEIVYAKEEISNRFVFKLNQVPERELTLEDFEIECPSDSNLTIASATFYVSPDLLTYVIVVPDNYGHKDNEYTVRIHLSDTEMVEKDFVTHFNPPVISGDVDSVVRTSIDSAKFNFNSDEAGMVYYGIYDWNGGIYDYNSTTPFASDVITGKIASKSQKLNAGGNTITLDLSGIETTNNTRLWALFVDEVGNYRVGFVDHYKIPEYKEVTPEPDTTLKIVDFKYTKSSFVISFNENIMADVTEKDIRLSVINGGSLASKIMYTIDNTVKNKVTISIQDTLCHLTPGEYEIALNVKDSTGKIVTLKERMIIE